MIFLPTNLRYLRESRGLTQTQLAEMMGVRPNTISNYENGNSSPDYEILGELVKILEVDAHSLLFSDLRPLDPERKPARVSDVSGFYSTGRAPDTEVPDGIADEKCAEKPLPTHGEGVPAEYDRRFRELDSEIEGLKREISLLRQKIGL